MSAYASASEHLEPQRAVPLVDEHVRRVAEFLGQPRVDARRLAVRRVPAVPPLPPRPLGSSRMPGRAPRAARPARAATGPLLRPFPVRGVGSVLSGPQRASWGLERAVRFRGRNARDSSIRKRAAAIQTTTPSLLPLNPVRNPFAPRTRLFSAPYIIRPKPPTSSSSVPSTPRKRGAPLDGRSLPSAALSALPARPAQASR